MEPSVFPFIIYGFPIWNEFMFQSKERENITRKKNDMDSDTFMNTVKLWRMHHDIFWNFNELSYMQLLTLNMADKHLLGWKAKGRLLRCIGMAKKKHSKKQRVEVQQQAEQCFKKIKLITNPKLSKNDTIP